MLVRILVATVLLSVTTRIYGQVLDGTLVGDVTDAIPAAKALTISAKA